MAANSRKSRRKIRVVMPETRDSREIPEEVMRAYRETLVELRRGRLPNQSRLEKC